MTSVSLQCCEVRQRPPLTLYGRLVTWAFTLFQSARIIAYLPTMGAVYAAGHSYEHSLLTWVTWLGANLSMTCWLFEQTGHVITKAVVINACNTTMCFATLVVIALHRM